MESPGLGTDVHQPVDHYDFGVDAGATGQGVVPKRLAIRGGEGSQFGATNIYHPVRERRATE